MKKKEKKANACARDCCNRTLAVRGARAFLRRNESSTDASITDRNVIERTSLANRPHRSDLISFSVTHYITITSVLNKSYG